MDDRPESVDTSFPAPNIGRCIYGFVLFLVSIVSLIVFYLWAFIPGHLIEKTGITYFPSKYWAISIPIFFTMLLLIFGFIIYPAINLFLTPSLTEVSTVYDKYYCKAIIDKDNDDSRNQTINSGNDKSLINDLPLDYVCRLLYSNKRKSKKKL